MFSDLTGALEQKNPNHPVIASFEKQLADYSSRKSRGFDDLEEQILRLQREAKTFRDLYSISESPESMRDYRDRMFETEIDLLVAKAVFCDLKNDQGGKGIYLFTAVSLHIAIDINTGCENPENP